MCQSFAERVVTTLADTAYTVFAIDVDGDGGKDALAGTVSSLFPGAHNALRRMQHLCNEVNMKSQDDMATT